MNRQFFARSFLHVSVAALAVSGALVGAAQPAKTPSAAHPKGQYATLEKLPDWGGVWVLQRPAPGTVRERPEFKGEYRTRYEAWQKTVKENAGVAPRDTSNCMPPGMPNMMATGQYPVEFLFTPGRVTTHHEAWMQWRSIWTDGRPHPDDWDGGIFGHSIGKWEGSTLVVETIGIKTITELGGGMKHSDKLKITERISLSPKDPNQLLVAMTLEDPEALAKPYHINHTFKRERDWNLMEFICAENDRNPVGADGHTTFE
jgi:hypothetical protein